MNIAMHNELNRVLALAEQAGHGKKQSVYAQAAQDMGMSIQTLQRKLKELRFDSLKTRKRRADCGKSTLTRDEAVLISNYLMNSNRANGKSLASTQDALDVLRANGQIQAAQVDEETGEFKPLSPSAVLRALTNYRLHPNQLRRPAPKCQLASLHPNHCWQIDPSLCVLYYMPAAKGEALCVMRESEFYKNKPKNIRKIEKERVWRYVITDHTSGTVFVHYVLGAESGKNLVDAFIHATQKREKSPFYGIPKVVMVDPGSANTSSAFKNLLKALGTRLQVNEPEHPWAKGQVEQANNLVECRFEHRLAFMAEPPTTLDEINALVEKWLHVMNSTQKHSRTNQTRYAVWMRITQEQLIEAPPAELMRQLSYKKPETRTVDVSMKISFLGKDYKLDGIEHVMVGEKVQVTSNAWHTDVAVIITKDENGKETLHNLNAVVTDEFGFDVESPVIGESYKSMHKTLLDKNREELDALNENTKNNTPFDGKLDPMLDVDKKLKDVPEFMPKRSTPSDVKQNTQIEEPLMTCVKAAMQLRRRVKSWQPSYMKWLEQRYPDGVKDSQIDELVKRIDQGITAPLRSVGGKP